MVLSNKIRVIAGFVSFLALAFFFSCEKTFPGMILCIDCLDNEPLTAKLKLKLSADYSYKSINIDIYEGNLEDSILYRTLETSATSSEIIVPINKKYTLVAKYHIFFDDFYVVNSVTPTAIYDEVQCEKPCYYVINNVVNLRLKRVK